MALPAAHEPAFITSKLCADEEYRYKGASARSPESSRSTSPGSASVPASPLPSMAEGESENAGLPEYDYPGLFIRNTFIDTSVPRPISLDGFFEERRVHSCPVECPPVIGSMDGAAVLHRGQLPLTMTGGTVMDSAMAAAASASAAFAAATRCLMRGGAARGSALSPSSPPEGLQTPVLSSAGFSPCAMSPSSPPPPGLQPPVLRLADAIGEPRLGSPEMPTMGSAGHHLGNCRPCAFFHTKGCGNGTQCSFCHLCPAGEKKRRQKEKGVMCRELKRMGFVVAP